MTESLRQLLIAEEFWSYRSLGTGNAFNVSVAIFCDATKIARLTLPRLGIASLARTLLHEGSSTCSYMKLHIDGAASVTFRLERFSASSLLSRFLVFVSFVVFAVQCLSLLLSLLQCV